MPLGGGKLDEVMQKKVENDAAAYIRSFVAQRGRNVELAEKGVLESLSFTEEEARKGISSTALPRTLTRFSQNSTGGRFSASTVKSRF